MLSQLRIATEPNFDMILLRSRPFLIGFFTGLLLVVIANIYTAYPEYMRGSNDRITFVEDFDGLTETGWPFRFHRSGTLVHLNEVLWLGLIADITIAIGIGIAGGILFQYLLSIWRLRLNRKERVE